VLVEMRSRIGERVVASKINIVIWGMRKRDETGGCSVLL
jgi:hypothetical protein